MNLGNAGNYDITSLNSMPPTYKNSKSSKRFSRKNGDKSVLRSTGQNLMDSYKQLERPSFTSTENSVYREQKGYNDDDSYKKNKKKRKRRNRERDLKSENERSKAKLQEYSESLHRGGFSDTNYI